MTKKISAAAKKFPTHKIGAMTLDGGAVPLCATRVEAIDFRWAGGAMDPKLVDCPKCLSILKAADG